MDAAAEFLRIAEDARAARDRCLAKQIQEPLKALREACEEVARAWSGSNFGYHSTIYYQGLRPKPAHVQFNPEWGLKDVWPTHQPDRGWVQMDYQTVSDQIVSRAGADEVKRTERELAPIREEFGVLENDVRIQVVGTGLDPTIGYLHGNYQDKHALVYDLMEPLRPVVDLGILEFVQQTVFTPADFTLASDGVCRLNPQLARNVVQIVDSKSEIANVVRKVSSDLDGGSRPIIRRNAR